MASLDGEIIGTFAYIKKEEDTYEFIEDGHYTKAPGKGYGKHHGSICCRRSETTRLEKADFIFKYNFRNSIHLYRKYGFVEVPLGDCNYARGNIKMERAL